MVETCRATAHQFLAIKYIRRMSASARYTSGLIPALEHLDYVDAIICITYSNGKNPTLHYRRS